MGTAERRSDLVVVLSNQPELARDLDFKRLVRKPKHFVPDEKIVDGVTHKSIEQFKRALESRPEVPEPAPTLMARLRRLFLG